MVRRFFNKWMQRLSDEERHDVLTQAVSSLYNTVSKDDILQKKEGEVLFMGKPLTKGQIEQLRDDATIFKSSLLYKVLDADCKYHANRRMFVTAPNLAQLEAGKVMTYLWDVIKTRLNQL